MKLNNSSMFFAAGVAGAVAGLASSLPIINLLNCLLCGWIWIGGIAAVYLYNGREPIKLQPAQGALVGALAGVVASIVTVVLSMALGGFGVAAASLNDPEIAQYLDQFGGREVVGGLAASFGLVCNVVIYGGFGALGGLIGAALFKNKTA